MKQVYLIQYCSNFESSLKLNFCQISKCMYLIVIWSKTYVWFLLILKCTRNMFSNGWQMY